MFCRIIFKRLTKFWYEYTVFGRIFWSIVLTLSTFGMAIFSYYIFYTYQTDPVSLSVDTDFIHWNLSFPAVSLCLVANTRTSQQKSIINDLNMTVKGPLTSFMSKLKPCLFSYPNELDLGFVKCLEILAENKLTLEDLKKAFLTTDCHDIVESIDYDGKKYQCTEILKFHITEKGYCFTINSIIDSGYSHESLKLKYSIETNNKTLYLRLKYSISWKYVVYVHSPEDFPSDNSFNEDIGRGHAMYSFHCIPIATDAEAAKTSIALRGCRFPHEQLGNYPIHYSFSTCISYLRTQLELNHCNCTFSSAPETYRSQYCGAEGIECLVNGNFYEKACQLAMDEHICIPPCTEQLLQFVGRSEVSTDNNHSDLTIQIINIPESRYVRTLASSTIDLAVSIAGLAGLFFGASVLNFVELIYYMITGK